MAHAHGHFHERMAELARRQQQDGVSVVGGTAYSVVYVTAQPTFTGVIGGYTTLTSASAQASQTEATDQNAGATTAAATSPTLEFSTAPTETVVAQDSSTAAASLISQATISQATTSENVDPTTTSFVASSTAAGSVAPASATTGSASSDTSGSSSSGMSTGAKAGIAVGVIAAVGLLAVFLLWFLGKKRRAREAEANKDNEKSTYGAGAATEMINRSPTVSSAVAPRLSLRPISKMMPEFLGNTSKGRFSNGNLLNTIGESRPAPSRNLTPSPQPRGPSPTPKPSQEQNPDNPFADPQNPFADPEKPIQAPAPVAVAPPSAIAKPASVAPLAEAAAAAMAASAAATVAAETKPDLPATPEPAKVPEPTSVIAPAPTASAESVERESLSSASSTAVGAAPGTAGTEPPSGNVFRVLMDFKPSMDDELELKAGQLVRCLHEYDDGWALCIRLDRSQQGVVPRTCLAAKPSKPKPSHLNQYARPPPPGQGPISRPMSPAGGPQGRNVPNFNSPRLGMPPQSPVTPAGRSMSPASARSPMTPVSRPMSPGHFNQAPRPLSPGPRRNAKRSMSPDPYGGRGPAPMAVVNRRRSNSASTFRDRRTSPAGPSKLGPGTGIAL